MWFKCRRGDVQIASIIKWIGDKCRSPSPVIVLPLRHIQAGNARLRLEVYQLGARRINDGQTQFTHFLAVVDVVVADGESLGVAAHPEVDVAPRHHASPGDACVVPDATRAEEVTLIVMGKGASHMVGVAEIMDNAGVLNGPVGIEQLGCVLPDQLQVPALRELGRVVRPGVDVGSVVIPRAW